MSEFNVRPGSLGASPAPTMRGPARARDRSTIPVLPELIPTTLLWGGGAEWIHSHLPNTDGFSERLMDVLPPSE